MAEHPRYDHERSDTELRPLIIFGGGLLALTVFSMLAMWALFGFLQDRTEGQFPEPSPLRESIQRPAVPQLQADPARDLEMLMRRDEGLLQSYEWIDPVNNIVRIPIGRALKVVAEKQLLPHRQDQGPSAEAPDRAEEESDDAGGDNP